ncbi:CHAT domain-containing protein [Rhodocytophaga rosea]|uniref:CHAT domain-containing protein n=1 Tax=Rhodocytophaga rosea TaxID=2704465 RepID=A0A6C0GPG6_9BACT|nr:CHAT domain-containing protein [Rhodocytophaga rosea]QHT69503.1 CHAT domain-containing protein [Rhodocytophaga rosea]
MRKRLVIYISLLFLLFTFTPIKAQQWQALYDSSFAHLNRGEFKQAISTMEQALAVSKTNYASNPKDTLYAVSLADFGYIHMQSGDYSKAEDYFKQALTVKEKSFGKNSNSYAVTVGDLANLYRDTGKYALAEDLYKQALDIYKTVYGEKHYHYGVGLNNLAQAYEQMGRYEQAISQFKKALPIYKEALGEKDVNYAAVLNNTAMVYEATGYYELAEPLYTEVLAILKETVGEKHEYYATTLSNIAVMYEYMGRYPQAEALNLQALAIKKESVGEQSSQYAISLNNLAFLYKSMKQYEKSEPLLKQALAITKATLGEKHPNYARSLNNLALLYNQLNKYEEAIPLQQQALAIYKEAVGEKHGDYASSLNNLAFSYKLMKRYDQAEPIFKQAIAINKEVLGERHPSYTRMIDNLAFMYVASGRLPEAETLIHQSISNSLRQIENYFPALSDREKEQFNNTVKNYFEKFNTFALMRYEQNPAILGDMYNNQLSTKALLLNASSKVKQRILNSNDTSLIKTYRQWLSEKENLVKIYKLPKAEIDKQEINLDSLEQHANTLEKELSRRSAVFAQSSEQIQPNWQSIQKTLKKKEAAIELIRFRTFNFSSIGEFSDTVYYAALLVSRKTKNHPQLILLKNGNELEGRRLNYYRNTMLLRQTDSTSYPYYWQDIAKALKGIRKVYLSPDGVYNQININTLLNPKTQKYLIEEIDVQSVTNTKDLLATGQAGTIDNKTASLFGSPDYNIEPGKREVLAQQVKSNAIQNTDPVLYALNLERSDNLVILPGTKMEIDNIHKITSEQQWKNDVFVEEQALEEHIKALHSPKVLHIATHGYFEKDIDPASASARNPLLRSGLMMAGAAHTLKNPTLNAMEEQTVEDGILTAYEAMNLDLDHTDLVVLSACDTGLGEVKNGEGVYGLQRAFKVAGAQSLIMSLWKVNDQTTQELMTRFYQAWMRSGSPHVAFRQAQLQLKQQHSHPYYWGAFVITGK